MKRLDLKTAFVFILTGLIAGVCFAGEPLRLTLDSAVKLALERSPMLKAAQAEVNAAAARASREKAQERLSISATAVGSKSDMGANLTTPPGVMPQNVLTLPAKRTALGDLMAMYPIFTGGKLRSNTEAGHRLATAAANDRKTAELDVVYEVRRVFWGNLLAKALVEEYAAAADESRERVRIAEEQHKEGKIALYDLLRNRTALAEAEQQVNNAKRDFEVAAIGLRLAIGLPAGEVVDLAGGLSAISLPGGVAPTVSAALESRPEILAARERVAASELKLAAAKASYMPQVYVTGMADAMHTSDDSDQGYMVGLVASLPLVDGGMRKAEVREAEAMLSRAEADLEQARLRVEAEARAAWAQVVAARENLRLAEAAVQQADEDYRVVKLRYEAGKGINVEVLDALAAMVRAKTNRLQATFELNVSADAFARASGTTSTR